jgi:hypothetical protein
VGRGDALDVQAHAAHVERKAAGLANAWFTAATDAVQAYEFLAMAEAGELAATAAFGALNRGDGAIAELVEFALPLQERHLRQALDATHAAAAGVVATLRA